MTEFECYQNYLALKLHFGGDYDFHRYNGKVSATLESFEKRKDKFKFVKLSRKLSDPQIIDYYLANFIRGKKWIGDFEQKNWIEHKKINQSLHYFYKNDLEKLLTFSHEFDILFKCDNGNHPKLVKAYLGKKISLETLVILEKVLQYRERFDKDITEKFIWPKVSKLIKDYEPFMKVSVRRFKRITLNTVKEYF
jgi:hypothetical protein|tara:strand:- start:750 stop:1331 length:582 start_codon:yes stop_codon:yes gene_type:complete